MSVMLNSVKKFVSNESGATAIEYGLIAALIAVGIIAAATTLGTSLSNLFGRIAEHPLRRVSRDGTTAQIRNGALRGPVSF